MNLGEWLKGSLSHDSQIRKNSTQQLKASYQNDFSQYITSLTQELVNPNGELVVRSAAAIAIKNALKANEATFAEEKLQKWASVPPSLKTQMKEAILQTLDSAIGLQSALSISAIASIDLPQNQWPELMVQLLKNVTESNSSETLKANSLATIGYICESTESQFLVSYSASILTAVINGARKQEPSVRVRKCAFEALFNSLSFIRSNFDKEIERNFIMQVVCEGTQEEDSTVRLSAFECLNKIVDLYYSYMEMYMNRALFGITMQSMQSDDESIVLQAIEFWSSVCEREIKITDAETEAYELKTPCSVKCLGFAHQICKDLVPVLFWFLTQQDEDMDEDEWSPAMAASTCLNLLSQCVGPEIVTYALPLIEQHLRNSDWHHREAAVMLFGCILEGTTSEQQSKLVVQALPFLLALTQDAHIQIRDTSFWTLGRICEFVIQDLPQTLYPDIMTALVRGLTEPSRVTISSSWSLMLFAESTMSSNPHIDTNAVSPFFETVVTALMQLSAREDLTKTARTSAYEALAAWISASANDTVPKLNLVAQEIVRRLEFTLSTITTFSDPVQELLSNFISVLSSLIRRLGKDVAPASDTFMQLLFRVLEVTSKPVDENQEYPSIQEDVLLCIGSVANSLELQFQRYSDSLIPFLVQALSHHEYHALCTVAVGVVADVARALEGHFLPYTQGFMEVLGKHLANPQLQLSVKLAILTCFGDIALAIGGEAFEPYLPVVMHILIQVCTAPEFMPTLQDSLESIRESSIEALVGIVQAFSACHKLSLMLPWIQFILGLIYSSIQSKNNVDHHSRNMAGLLGDIAVGLGKDVKEALLQPWVYEYLSMLVSTRLYSSTTRDTAKWARDRIRAM